MSIILAWPDLFNPAVEVVLPDVEQLPSSRPTRRLQAVYETDGGATVVYDFSADRSVYTLQLYPLSAAHVNAIQSFFKDTVNAQAVAWWLQDSFGNEYNVRFAQDAIEPMQRGVSSYAVTLTMRVI